MVDLDFQGLDGDPSFHGDVGTPWTSRDLNFQGLCSAKFLPQHVLLTASLRASSSQRSEMLQASTRDDFAEPPTSRAIIKKAKKVKQKSPHMANYL